MQWLTAALAFSTTMLFFAAVVSTLVEMVHRFFRLREGGLALMLESLFERVIEPQRKNLGLPSDLDAKAFADLIMTNRAVSASRQIAEGGNAETLQTARKRVADALEVAKKAVTPKDRASANAAVVLAKENLDRFLTNSGNNPRRISRVFRFLLSASRTTDVPVEVFTQKLADSSILNAADDKLDDVVQDISQKYVAFGAEATDYFRKRARLLSVLLAFPVAIFFYVHPYDLARTFMSDPELAKQVAAFNVEAAFGKGEADGNTEQGAKDEGAATENQAMTAEQERKALEEENKRLKEAIKKWDELAIPVGWPDPTQLAACPIPIWDNLASRNCLRDLPIVGQIVIPGYKQIFWLLVGGLLIGLGAPFWAQAIAAITTSRAAVDKIGSIVGGDDTIGPRQKAGSASGTLVAPVGEDKPMPTSVRTFRVSKAAQEKLPS